MPRGAAAAVVAGLLVAQAMAPGCDAEDDCAISDNQKRCACPPPDEGATELEGCSDAALGGPSLCCRVGDSCSCGLWECALDVDDVCLCSATIWSAASADADIVDGCPSSFCCLDTETDGCLCADALADGCSPGFERVPSCSPDPPAATVCTSGSAVPRCVDD